MSRVVVIPKCEVCKTERAIIFAPDCGRYPSVGVPNNWKFLCKKCNTQEYFFLISDYYKNKRQQEDWLKHLSGKNWFDIIDFGDMLMRYQHDVKSASMTLDGVTYDIPLDMAIAALQNMDESSEITYKEKP